MLEHLDYLYKIKNFKTNFAYSAYKISQIDNSMNVMTNSVLSRIDGIGQVTLKIINEILKTGTCSVLEKYL